MQMLAVMCLAVVWAAILVPPMLRKHRDGRPANSVVSFRRQLSTLERATPGTSLKPLQPHHPLASGAIAPPGQMSRSQVVRRRRDVLLGLAGASTFTFLLAVAFTGPVTVVLFLASAGALGAYVYALVQLRMRADEAAAKVRVLRPQATAHVGSPALSVRRSASS